MANRVTSAAGVTAPIDQWRYTPEVVRIQRRTRRVLLFTQAIASFGMGAGPSVGILLAEEVTGTELLAGVARTMTTFGAAIFGVLLAILAARVGRRLSLVLGLAAGTVGAAVLIAAASLMSTPLMIGGMLLFGGAGAVTLQTRFAATDLEVPERSGRSLSLVVWLGTIGAVIGPNLGTPGKWVSAQLTLPPLAGAFVISAIVLAGTTLLVYFALRPDPLLEAKRFTPIAAADVHTSKSKPKVSSFRELWTRPDARIGFMSTVASHLMMVALMTMTPVHMDHQGASLELIGITISVHILGMYAFSPLVGMLVDRIGPRRVAYVAHGTFVLAGITGIVLGNHHFLIEVPLFLLGLAWSFGMIAGSVQVTRSIPSEVRTRVQGYTDASMNFVAAGVALLAGPLMAAIGFDGISVILIAVAVVMLLVVRFTRVTRSDETLPSAG